MGRNESVVSDIRHWIDGAHVAGDSPRAGDVFNPATGEVSGRVRLGDAAVVDAAVRSATAASARWSETSVLNRARVMFRFKELLDRHHYLGYRIQFGASLRYLVRSARAPENVLACLLWSSPAWKMAPRDAWIGWSDDERARNLQLIVNNSRFLILPWVRVKGLASMILGACAHQLPRDWEKRYGYRPLLLETLVDAGRFRGTCYRAANWIKLGQTTGRGRMDREHAAHGAAVKDLYVYPLCRRVQQRLRSAAAPLWQEPEQEVRRP